MTENSITTGPGGTVFTGPKAVSVFGMIALAAGLEMYAKYKVQPSKHYTPKKMLEWANMHTGQTFKRGQYMEAAAALRVAAKEKRSTFE